MRISKKYRGVIRHLRLVPIELSLIGNLHSLSLGVDPAPSGAGESIFKYDIMKKVFMNLKKVIFPRLCVLTEIIYDSQDNLVKINNGSWVTSWDYLNSQPAGNIAVLHFWNKKEIVVFGNFQNVRKVKVNGKVLPYSIGNNTITLVYDDMHWWMNNSDLFYIDIIQ